MKNKAVGKKADSLTYCKEANRINPKYFIAKYY